VVMLSGACLATMCRTARLVPRTASKGDRAQEADEAEQHFVNHTDGFTMQYGNPANSAHINNRIQLIRKHFVKMSTGEDIASSAALKSVECPLSDAMWKRRGLSK
jgi:hypothetical protein